VLYFGGVAAGISHEISNILNIINELAGLQHDIAAVAAGYGDARVGRIADLADRIKAQVTRGEEVNRRLHSFAHSVDEAETTFDLVELFALLAFLEGRPARLAGVELTVRAPEHGVSLHGDPFSLGRADPGCGAAALRAAGSGGRVDVEAERHDGGARIRVACGAPLPADVTEAASASALRAGAASWGATVTVDPATDTPRSIVVTVPATSARASRTDGDRPPEEVS
jgi:hypothetical protein